LFLDAFVADTFVEESLMAHLKSSKAHQRAVAHRLRNTALNGDVLNKI